MLERAQHAHAIRVAPSLRTRARFDVVAPFSTLSALGFFAAYMVLHALHATGRDPHFMQEISAIPLFAGVQVSALVGLVCAAPTTLVVLARPALLDRLAGSLAFAVCAFVVEILLLP